MNVEYASGHLCVSNGVGDYDFVCPTRGVVGFLPYMIALTLTPERVCPLCNLAIGQAKIDTPPSAPEGQPKEG